MERFKLLATVCLLLTKENKILLIRRFNTGWHDGDYDLPSGHIDGREPVTKAAIREAKEEIGVSIELEDLSVVHVMHRYGEKNERIEFFLKAEKWQGIPMNTEPDKCDDVSWFQLDQLPKNMIPKTKFAIEQFVDGKYFSEFDWDK